jgi:stringent starvation protein B
VTLSTKPYLLRAMYEWCVDAGFTPHLAVKVDANTRVPMEFVKDGQIVLNISAGATRNLTMDNDWVGFSARFGGASREISVPMDAVLGIYARENGQGMGFEPETVDAAEASAGQEQQGDEPAPPPKGRPKLSVVK